jgi:hypothetical protein
MRLYFKFDAIGRKSNGENKSSSEKKAPQIIYNKFIVCVKLVTNPFVECMVKQSFISTSQRRRKKASQAKKINIRLRC